MAGEWSEYSLGELTENFDSIRVPIKEAERRPGPYPYYGASGVVDHVDGYLFDGRYLLVAEDGENLRTRKTPVAFLANGRFWVNNHAHIIRANRKADTRFLMYALSIADIGGYLTGSTMPKLTQGNLNRIRLRVPERYVQRAIAHILGTLDDNIELNRRMNDTLEALARLIFKSWFVDQDQGVEEVRFAEVIDFKEGPGIMALDFRDEGVPLVRLAGLEENASLLAGCNFLDPLMVERRWRQFRLAEGDTLLSTSASLGRVAVVSRDAVGAIPYTGLIRMRPADDRLLPELIPYVLKSDHFQDQVESFGAGSVLRHFGPMHLKQMSVRVGPKNVQAEFARLMAPVWSRLRNVREESRTLATLRDTLLPKLVSGELRVRDAEKIAARAL